MEYLYKNIIKAYEKEVLSPLLGEGRLKNELIDGLELILNRIKSVDIPEDIPYLDSRPISERLIDFTDIEQRAQKSGNYNMFRRLQDCLRYNKIKTYGDAIDAAKAMEDSVNEVYFNSFEKVGGVRKFIKAKGVGKKPFQLFYSHLDALGISLFSNGYLNAEIIKD